MGKGKRTIGVGLKMMCNNNSKYSMLIAIVLMDYRYTAVFLSLLIFIYFILGLLTCFFFIHACACNDDSRSSLNQALGPVTLLSAV